MKMGLALKYGYSFLCVIMVLLPAICHSQDFTCSRATYYGSSDGLGTPNGACGFGEYGRTVNNAEVAAVSRLYKNGTGCGACYQVRCKAPKVCSDNGVNIVVTDYGEGDNTDFILSKRAYARMARPNMALKLFTYGIVDIEYRRIPCRYTSNYNLMVKVHENSRFPEYLAIIILYQSGKTDILAVQIWQEDCKEWLSMRKAFGAVWDMPNPPKGPITFRFQVSGNAGVTWVQATNAIPSQWKAGAAYDSKIKLP